MECKLGKKYQGRIKAVIFDMAGTIVDYGSCAPAGVFVRVFAQKQIKATIEQARVPMGMHKRDHIKIMTEMPEIASQWLEVYGHECSDSDRDEMYEAFIPLQLEQLPFYSSLIPGFLDVVERIKNNDILIATTTGYNRQMADIVLSEMAKAGFEPDVSICAEDVPNGRPYPWMLYHSMEKLGVFPPEAILKVGDTIPDIEAGLNAGVWTAGVLIHGNGVGLPQEEVEKLNDEQLACKLDYARSRFDEAGSHFVIEHISNCPDVIDEINTALKSSSKS